MGINMQMHRQNLPVRHFMYFVQRRHENLLEDDTADYFHLNFKKFYNDFTAPNQNK